MGDKRKALAHLSRERRSEATTPAGLAKLVRDKVVDEKYINRLLLKVGGMSGAPRPRAAGDHRKLPPVSLGKPFLTAEGGAVALHHLAQANPKGFRQPSRKPKNWQSTSLMEKVTGVKPTFTRSVRGDKKERADAEYRELVRATQDVRNIPRVYLTKSQKRLKTSLPPLPKELTLGGIQERHALTRPDHPSEGDPTGAPGATM